MRLRTILNYGAAVGAGVSTLLAALTAAPASAQENPAKRLSAIVGVAVEEYGKGVAANGKVSSQLELDEATTFLADARGVAARLEGPKAEIVRALVDSLASAANAVRPPAEVAALYARFTNALGREGALDLPSRKLDVAEGRALYERNCASCHGLSGEGNGPASRGMSPPPPAVGTAEVMNDLSPAMMYRIMTVGVAGTAMTAWTSLTSEQRWNVIAYLQSLVRTPEQVARGESLFGKYAPPEASSFAWQAERSDAQLDVALRNAAQRPGAARTLSDNDVLALVSYVRAAPTMRAPADAVATSTADSLERSARQVLALLDEALLAARNGRLDQAGDRSFDAYIAFEPLETTARAKNPGLVSRMEQYFLEFKGAIRSGDMAGAQRARAAVAVDLPSILELARPDTGRWAPFVQSFLIILREGFEAILVLGAIAAILTKTGQAARMRSLWTGAWLGLGASAVAAVVLATLLRAIPASREIVEGATMLVAVVVLFSVSYWLVSKVEAARWQQFIREKVDDALSRGGGAALGLVAFLAVFREGAETALFYQALLNQGSSVYLPVGLGMVVGAIALAVIFIGFRRFGVKMPMRPFFAVTSGLLYAMAFIFAGQGIRELQEGDAVSLTPLPGMPTVSWLGIYPTAETLLAQGLLLGLLLFALVRTSMVRRQRAIEAAIAAISAPSATVPDTVLERVRELEEIAVALRERVEVLETALASSRGEIAAGRPYAGDA
jgi:high-affinity iron transporter